MRTILIAAAAALSLAACSASQQAKFQAQEQQAQAAIQAACVKDGQLQPIAVTVAASAAVGLAATGQAGAAAAVQTGIALDETVIHQAVVAACAKIGAVPATDAPAAMAN